MLEQRYIDITSIKMIITWNVYLGVLAITVIQLVIASVIEVYAIKQDMLLRPE